MVECILTVQITDSPVMLSSGVHARSDHGNHYTLTLYDPATKIYYRVHMVFKGDVYDATVEFIETMWKDDHFKWINYPFAVQFLCDRDPQ